MPTTEEPGMVKACRLLINKIWIDNQRAQRMAHSPSANKGGPFHWSVYMEDWQVLSCEDMKRIRSWTGLRDDSELLRWIKALVPKAFEQFLPHGLDALKLRPGGRTRACECGLTHLWYN